MRKIIVLFVGLLYISFSLIGQELYLKVKLHPSAKTKNYTIDADAKVKGALQKYKSYQLQPRYPNAKTPELADYYDIIINEKISTKGVDSLIRNLSALGIFELVEKEKPCYALGCPNPTPMVNDPWSANWWGGNYWLEFVDAYCAWTISKGNPEVVVGIVDIDFETTHEDLKNQIIKLDQNGDAPFGTAHGTNVAGLVAAETNNNKGIAGIGYNSKIAAYKLGGMYGDGNVNRGIWLLHHDKRKIINVSISETGLEYLAAKEITESGTVLVLAAGNDTAVYHAEIANIPGVIVVSSVNQYNMYAGHARNKYVDICAPGVNIGTTTTGNSYAVKSGTSLAAPIVSGTIALMLDVNPCLSAAEIERVIKETADPIADGAFYPGLLGAGRINAYKALIKAGTKSYSNTSLPSMSTGAGYQINLTNSSVQPYSNVELWARKEVNIYGTFEVPRGSTLEININQRARNSCN